MADQTVITYEPHGPASTGMPEWDPMPAEAIAQGSPVQRGHEYFNTAGGALNSGVWDCTPWEGKFAPYGENEFMLVLEGSIHIVDESGATETYSKGEGFILPKGTPCTWKQTEYCRKFYVIFDDPVADRLIDASDLASIRIDCEAALPEVTGHDPALYESEVPSMHQLPLYRDASAQFEVGLWSCTPMQRKPATIARSELMHILEGRGTITNADGVVYSFGPGDTFMVPIGMGYQWQNTETVKKIYCSFTPNDS